MNQVTVFSKLNTKMWNVEMNVSPTKILWVFYFKMEMWSGEKFEARGLSQ